MSDLVRYERRELEKYSLADRMALEGALKEALPVLREMNDAEILRLAESGVTQEAIATMAGVDQATISRRLVRLGYGDMHPHDDVPQSGDEPTAKQQKEQAHLVESVTGDIRPLVLSMREVDLAIVKTVDFKEREQQWVQELRTFRSQLTRLISTLERK